MHDTKERLSLLWIFALLNYLYADVLALFAFSSSVKGCGRIQGCLDRSTRQISAEEISKCCASLIQPDRSSRH